MTRVVNVSVINACLLSSTHLHHVAKLFSPGNKSVASSLLFIVTNLAFPPPLQPLLSLTFSDIYPPPQWQHPAHSHQPAWVSPCGLVCSMLYSKSKTELERRGGQTVKRESRAGRTKHIGIYFSHTHNTYTNTHKQPPHKCSLCLHLSLFVTTLYDQQLREKDTLRGRAGQAKKD